MLDKIHQKCLTLGATATATATAIQHVFCSEGLSIPRLAYELEMAPLQAIHRMLQDLDVSQASTLQEFTVRTITWSLVLLFSDII